MAISFLSSINIDGSCTVTSISNDNSTYTGILVWDGSALKYRTKAQLLSDIGAGSGSGTVTSVTVTGSDGLSGTGTVTSSGTITLSNSDKGSSQAIYKNVVADSGGTATANSNNDSITIAGGNNVSTVRSGDTITINATDTDTNNYVSSVSFNTTNGILTLNRSGLTALTVDLDGRYVTSSGVTSIDTTNGITDHSKKYYTTSSQYLKARGQTYAQKLSIHRIEGYNYSDPTTGSHLYYINSPVGTDLPGGCKNIETVYKPSNQQYATQGAVESGTRIMRLKNSILRPQRKNF